MKRQIKDFLKQAIFVGYKLGTRVGVHILPVHYYSALPNLIELEKTKSVWAKKSAMPGVSVDLDQQAANLRTICGPYKGESLGNKVYYEGVAKKFGPGFGFIEAQALHAFIRHYKAGKIVEVGSGVSTYCMMAALKMNEQEGGQKAQITCVEPYPSDRLQQVEGVRLVREKVQSVPYDVFTELGEGDLLFIDSSHAVKAGGDVNHLFLEVLPRLAPGVIVHVHDINFPYDYQTDVLKNFLHQTEVSLLRAYLIFNDRIKIVVCLSQMHYDRQEALAEVFPDYDPRVSIDGLWDDRSKNFVASAQHFPSSIYLQTQ